MLHVLYLIFNEGYTSSVGAHLQRLELSREAIRLTRRFTALLPDDARGRGIAGAHVVDRCAPRGTNRAGRRVDPA